MARDRGRYFRLVCFFFVLSSSIFKIINSPEWLKICLWFFSIFIIARKYANTPMSTTPNPWWEINPENDVKWYIRTKTKSLSSYTISSSYVDKENNLLNKNIIIRDALLCVRPFILSEDVWMIRRERERCEWMICKFLW